MTFSRTFYRSAAICSVLSAVTTLGLIFLPELYAPAEGFEGRMMRVHDPAYVLRSWIYLIHPFLTLMAALAVAMRIRAMASAAAVIGLLGFVLWAFTEAGQQTLTLFAFDRWRAAYPTADAAYKAQVQANAAIYDGLWDATYFLLLIGFTIGNAFLGWALVRARGLTRIVGYFFFGAVALTLGNISRELGWFTLPASIEFWSYPMIQPLGRTLIGVWLWKASDETRPALP